MLTKLKNQSKGFTIIEVLIVLAIAGLILLIVFLAVPALQRNSRNTNRRNDVSSIIGKLQESVNNNNGNVIIGTNEPDIVLDKLGFYQGTGSDDWTSVDYSMSTTADPGVVSPMPDGQTVYIRNRYKCNSTYASTPAAAPPITIGNAAGDIVTTTGASNRTIVAIFGVEASGNNLQAQCVDS